MNSLEKISLENEIFEIKALSSRDILSQQSALVFLDEYDAMHLGLWSCIFPRSLGLLGPTLNRSIFTVSWVSKLPNLLKFAIKSLTRGSFWRSYPPVRKPL